jgi:predicted ATPase
VSHDGAPCYREPRTDPTMTTQITELRIAGLRTLADVVLPLDGLTVLIGNNGSGKSSLIEGIELLRKLSEPNFYSLLHEHHGGLPGLLRRGIHELRADGELGSVLRHSPPAAGA